MMRGIVLASLMIGGILLLAAGVRGFSFLATDTCKPAIHIERATPVDARDNGYLLAGGFHYFRPAVYDLVQGRIRYFEMETGAGQLLSYRLADHRSADCIARSLFDAHLAGLPMRAGQCVAAVEVKVSGSRYRIDSDATAAGQAPDTLSLTDLQTGEVLASYEKARGLLPWLGLSRDSSTCGNAATVRELPLWQLSGFVFLDRWGEVLSPAELTPSQADEPAAPPPSELTPQHLVRYKLAAEDLLDRRHCHLPGWMGATEVHVLELQRGPLEVEARLDAASHKAGVVLVDVHAPGKAVVLIAHAQNPTIWHIHESSSSTVVAVLVRAQAGQAVLGLTPHSRILMSTQRHNPYTQCTTQELQDIELQLAQQYGITRTQRQNPDQQPATVRYGVGEEMPAGGQLFHHDSELADFEISAGQPAPQATEP